MSDGWNRKARYGVRENGGGRPRIDPRLLRVERVETLLTAAERELLDRHYTHIGVRMRQLIIAEARRKESTQ